MPDHVHAILSPMIKDGRVIPLWRILKSLKGASARNINRESGTFGRVWQDESFDHVLRNSSQLYDAIDYIAENPVASRLVKIPSDYPWLLLR